MTKPKDKHTNPGYELSDAQFRPLLVWAIGLVVLVIGALGISFGLFDLLHNRSEATMAQPSPLIEGRQLPPFPRLQVKPEQAWQVFEAKEDSELNSYGWVGRDAGIVRIPIDEAMQIALDRGFPVRPEAPSENANRPGGFKK